MPSRPNPNQPAWTRLLVLEGNRVAIWESPDTRTYHVATPGSRMPTTEGTLGHIDLHAALREGALTEGFHRIGRPIRAKDAPALTRTVLWGTQSTPEYHHAPRPVQLALEVALTSTNPVRASYARLRQEERGNDR